MRHRYIRFFVSSTFADMTRERNLLQRLFDKLSAEYARRKWQLELIDLRWGISQEAGLDNKTMRICKDEIARCQLLSPRPNFIILLGNRYGWTPLPETIRPEDVSGLKMGAEEEKLFNRWYRFDANALPHGEYVLQRRTPPYNDALKWFDDVEYPLSKIFTRATSTQLFGLSATEQEIQIGALQVDDANRHVVAYMRDLILLPKEQVPVYENSEIQTKQAMKALREQVKEKLNSQNIYATKLAYTQYISQAFDHQFEIEMEKRIRRVIEDAINDYNNSSTNSEDEEHMLLAQEEASHFIGRHDILAKIDEYIYDPKEHRPLWIKGHSGCGKSALLAKVAVSYSQSHRVICRFCGQTAQVMDVKGLYESIDRVIPEDIRFSNEIDSMRIHSDFQKLEPDIPTIIILDALNQIDDRGDLDFSKLEWLKVDLKPKVKVIISTTDDLKYSNELSFLCTLQLPDMGFDSELIVTDILQRKKRRLTASQAQILTSIISKSDHTAIYLRTLGHYLATIPSWEDISDVPTELTSLIRYYISELSQPERHGYELTMSALSLLTYERQGLSQQEMLGMLSMDEQLYKKITESSFHQIEDNGTKRLPMVLWSRLNYDLQPFLRLYNTKGGRLTTFFHSEARNAIRIVLGEKCTDKTDSETYYRKILFNYYAEHARHNDRHALLELFHSMHYPNSKLIDSALDFIRHNFQTLLSKYQFFPDELLTDFDLLLNLLTDDDRKNVVSLKQQMSTLPREASNEQLSLYIASLPSQSLLYQLTKDEIDNQATMKNLLADHEPPNSTIYALSEVGESPCMSENGTKVASLLQNGHEVLITDILNPVNSHSILYKECIVSLACDDDMHLLLIGTKDTYVIRDLQRGKNIFELKHDENTWISLSGNGRKLVYGNSHGSYFYELDSEADDEALRCRFIQSFQPALYGRITPSAKYLWLLNRNRSLVRMDVESNMATYYNNIRFLYEEDKPVKGDQINRKPSIINCMDNCCVCYDGKYAVKILDGNGYFYTSYHRTYPGGSDLNLNYNVVLSNDHQYVYYFEGLYCSVFRQKEEGDEFIVQNYIIPKCINRDFTLALIDNQIVDFRSQMHRYVSSDGNVGGINSLSSSYDGNLAVVSTGMNVGMEHRLELLKIIDGVQKEWLPPFSTHDYLFIRSSCVSPDGRLLSASSTADAMEDSNETGYELLLYSEADQRLITNVPTGLGGCKNSRFSNDSNYLAAIRGDSIADVTPALFVMDKAGKLIWRYEELTWREACFHNLIITEDNHYVISADFETFWVFDLLSGTPVSIDGQQRISYEASMGMGPAHARIVQLLLPGSPILSYDMEKQSIVISSLKKDKVSMIKSELQPVAASPSGLRLYMLDKNNRLYVRYWQTNNSTQHLVNDVLCVIPALDDDHIYIVLTDYTILLYNVSKQITEQKAYRGVTSFHQACAQGLYLVNERGEPALFHPRKDLQVNIPAVTTFVRRWNLNTKKQEPPSAICPMCGGRIEIDEQTGIMMKGATAKVEPSDWDAPHLKNHTCKHCGAQLRYNPFILS